MSGGPQANGDVNESMVEGATEEVTETPVEENLIFLDAQTDSPETFLDMAIEDENKAKAEASAPEPSEQQAQPEETVEELKGLDLDPKSRARDRIQELAKAKREQEAQLALMQKQMHTLQELLVRQQRSAKSEQEKIVERLIEENKQLRETFVAKKEEEDESNLPFDQLVERRALKTVEGVLGKRIEEAISPYKQKVEEFERSQKEAVAREQALNQLRGLEQQAVEASRKLLDGFSDEDRAALESSATDLTIALATAAGATPDKAVVPTQAFLERYFQARLRAAKSKNAAAVKAKQPVVTKKQPVAAAPPKPAAEQEWAKYYPTLWDARRDNYKRVPKS